MKYMRSILSMVITLVLTQTEFGPNVVFNMRTFRFNIQGTESEIQQQTVTCNLHLDPVADVNQNPPADCSCHTEAECQLDPDYPFGRGTFTQKL